MITDKEQWSLLNAREARLAKYDEATDAFKKENKEAGR